MNQFAVERGTTTTQVATTIIFRQGSEKKEPRVGKLGGLEPTVVGFYHWPV